MKNLNHLNLLNNKLEILKIFFKLEIFIKIVNFKIVQNKIRKI